MRISLGFLRFLIIFGLPTAFLYYIISSSALNVCLKPLASHYQIEQEISQKLEAQNYQFQIYQPIINLAPGWFVYDVSIANDLYSTDIRASASSSPVETEPIPIQVIDKNNATTTLTVGEIAVISHNILPEAIPGLVHFMAVAISPTKAMLINGFPNNFSFLLETGPGSGICYEVRLSKTYQPLIWLVLWAFFMGILVLLKEAINFCFKPLKTYFGIEENSTMSS